MTYAEGHSCYLKYNSLAAGAAADRRRYERQADEYDRLARSYNGKIADANSNVIHLEKRLEEANTALRCITGKVSNTLTEQNRNISTAAEAYRTAIVESCHAAADLKAYSCGNADTDTAVQQAVGAVRNEIRSIEAAIAATKQALARLREYLAQVQRYRNAALNNAASAAASARYYSGRADDYRQYR